MILRTFTVLLVSFVCACGASEGMSGPTMNNHVDDHADDPPEIQSNDILARDANTKNATVKHILISWKELGPNFGGHQDERAHHRTRKEADEIAVKLLARVRAGENMEALMS